MPISAESDVWVIIPGYNEEKYLDRVLTKTAKYTKHIIFVDDGSRDSSTRIAQRYTPHVLTHLTNLGKGAALKTGCEYAFTHLGASAVIFMDSDDQHDPKYLDAFTDAFSEGCEVVLGVRKLNKNMPLVRRLGNAFSSVLIWVLFGDYLPDIPCGYKGLTKKAYQQVKWGATDYAVETEIAARVAKYKLRHKGVVVDTTYHDLERGMTILDILKLALQIISWKVTL